MARTKTATETRELGEKFAKEFHGGEVIALVGDLGAGKTTFVQGLGKALGVERVISPTFILMRSYDKLHHLDLYRLEGDEKIIWEEVKNLGLEEIWQDPSNIVVIEWAEKIKRHLPKNTIWITFENISEGERSINVK